MSVPQKIYAICPALHLQLSSSDPITIEKYAQSISSIGNQTKTYGCSAFSLGASAETQLTYSSSNTTVATVSSAGTVTVKNPGTALITIKAAETDDYKAATKTVSITVKLKKPTLKNKSTGNKVKYKLNQKGYTKFKVRAYRTVNGKKIYSAYSNVIKRKKK